MKPQSVFLLLFVAAPLIELFVLIEVGSEIGAFSTIVLSVFTAVLGGLMVRFQGLSVWFRLQSNLAAGETPAIEALEAVALLLAGVALLLPGFITDALGFLLLFTPARRWFIKRMFKPVPTPQNPNKHAPRIIDGEFRREDD